MVWSQVCCVVQGYVVCRECTALANIMRHQVEIHPKQATEALRFKTLDTFSCTNAHFILFPLLNPQRRAYLNGLQQI